MKWFRYFGILIILALVVAACGPVASPEPAPTAMPETEAENEEMAAEAEESAMADEDIVDTAVAAGDFETLVAAVQAAGLVDALKGEGPFTVFAPTEEAFAALPEGTLDTLLADPEGDLTQILLYHVVPGKVMAADLSDGMEAETLQGAAVTFSISDEGAMVDGANIIATDIEASNGVIHVIDAVILPPLGEADMESESEESAMAEEDIVDTAMSAGDFETLLTAVQAAGLVGALKGEGPFTVFAPTDEAFAALPEGTLDSLLADPEGDLTQILLYHVVPGKVMAADLSDGMEAETLQGAAVTFSISDEGTMINEANIIATDIEATNGVIHVIDAVILPPEEEAVMGSEAEETATMDGDIVDAASAAGDFETLVTAVQAAGLVDALKGEGPFTVFAPTNEAFAALPEGTLDTLLADPEGDLSQILLYHVVPGKVMAADLSDGMEAETLEGASVTFSISDDGAMVDGANIIATDIEVSNGVIHVIDAVLLPPRTGSG
jgi:uncharacterized surface protein with fasciclin (FAS1) repeats